MEFRIRVLVIPTALAAATVISSACSGDAATARSDAPRDSGAGGSAGSTGQVTDAAGSGGSPFGLTDVAVGTGTGVCKEGTYAGMYNCNYQFDPDAGDAGGFPVSGPITLQLTKSSSGEFQAVADGKFGGMAVGGLFNISADISGKLNCSSGKFDGQLTNGMYGGFTLFGMPLINGAFMGPLESDYDGTNFGFVNGTWNLAVADAGSCAGTWSASYTGP